MLTNVWVACGGGRSKNNNNHFISIAPLKIAFTKCLQTEKAGYPEGSIAESQRVGWGKKESLIKVKTVGAKYTKNYDNFKQIRIKTTQMNNNNSVSSNALRRNFKEITYSAGLSSSKNSRVALVAKTQSP